MPDINPVYSTVTMVKVGNGNDFGTGFFYNFDRETYLVTNKHVLLPEGGKPAEEIRYFIRDYGSLQDINWISKSLDDGVGEDWFEPELNNVLDYDIDLAVIPINQSLSNFSEYINNDTPNVETGSTAFSPDMILKGEGIVSGGDVVLVIGYPDGLLDTNTYFPLLRNARISTPFGLAFEGQPKFITDAMMYPGMSGSPIVAGPRTLKNPATGGLRTTSQAFGLLGIHSANYQRPNGDRMERLNLNSGWYANAINLCIMNNVYDEDNPLDPEYIENNIGSLRFDPDVMNYIIRSVSEDQSE